MFYAPWCEACQPALHEFEVSNLFFEKHNEKYIRPEIRIRLGTFNCEKYKIDCGEWEIKSYPKIKILHQGGIYNYTGEKRREGFIKIVRKITQPNMLPIKDPRSYHNFKKESNVSFTLFTQISDQKSNFARSKVDKIAKRYRISDIWFSDCPNLEVHRVELVTKTPLIRKYGQDEEWHFQWDNFEDEVGLNKFIDTHRYPLLLRLESLKLKLIISDFKENNIKMILLASDGSQESRNLENLITQISRREKENFQFNWQPTVVNAEDYQDQIQIYTDKIPAVIILDFSQEPYPYYKVNSSHLQSVSKLENLLLEIQNENIEFLQPNENDYLKMAQRIGDYLFSPLFYQKHQSFAILLYSVIAFLAFSLIHCLCGFCFKKKNTFEEKKQKEDKKVEEEKNVKSQEGKKQEVPQKKKEEKKEVKNEKKVEETKEQNKQDTKKQSKQKSKKKSKKE